MGRRRPKKRSGPRVKWTRCAKTGKRSFQSKADALVTATNIPADYVRAYPCPDCAGFHLTTSRLRRTVGTGNRHPNERNGAMAEGKGPEVPDVTRSEERDAVERLKDDGVKLSAKTGYEVVRWSGERVYFSDDKADAEARLIERAAVSDGIGGKDGEGEPSYTLREVRYVEVEGFKSDGPESRTRGKRSGKPADAGDQDNAA